MQVEHVAGVRLATRRPPQHERQLAICRGLLGEVVVDAQRRLFLLVHEVLGQRAPRERRDVLHRGRLGGRSHDDDGVVHRIVLLEALDHGGHGRVFLADRDVDADHPLALLVDDRVDRDRRLAGATVADDELALAEPDRDHGVDRLDARLQRLLHRLPLDDAGRHDVDLASLGGVDRPEAVHRPAQRIDHAPDQGRAHRDVQHPAGAPHLVPLAQHEIVSEDHRPDVVLFEVQRLPGHLVPGLRGHDLADVDLGEIGRLDFLEQDLFQFAGSQDGIGRHGITSWSL